MPLLRYTKARIKVLMKRASKEPVLVAFVVEVQGGPKRKLWIFQRTSQGNRPSRWDVTRSLPFSEKFREFEDAEGAAVAFVAAYPQYIHKVRVREVRLTPTKFDWKVRGR